MGRKMSMETVDKYSRIREDKKKSIFARDNPSGYQLNVNHPLIRPMYERYKLKLGERILSDAQRLEFERKVILWLESKNICR